MINLPTCSVSGSPAPDLCLNRECGRCAFLCTTFCVECQKHREAHPVNSGMWDGIASQINDISQRKQPLKVELSLLSLQKEFERMAESIKQVLEDHRASLQVFKETLTLKAGIKQVLANLTHNMYSEVKGRQLYELVHSLDKDDLYENAGMVESFIRQKNDRMQRTLRQLEETLNKQLRLQSDRMRAWQLRQQNRYQQSKEIFAQIVKQQPEDSWSHWYLGVNQRCLGNYSKAVDLYTRAIEINPYDYEYYFSRAYSLSLLGKWREVVEDCSRAIQLKPNIPIYYTYRAEAYKKLGRHDLSHQDLEAKKALEG